MAQFGTIVRQLDTLGFDYGQTRISIYNALVVMAVLVLVFLAGQFASRSVRRLLRRASRLDATQQVIGEKVVSLLVWIFCFLFGADLLGVDLKAFAVFSGALGLAIGFGLQKTFGNLISGMILLMDRSIKPGDVIAVGGSNGTVGRVERIGMRAVSVITRDKIEFLIPNENLMVNQVENWSYSSKDVRVKVPVSVADNADLELAERLMLEAARACPRVLENPPPDVWLRTLGASAIEFELQLWIDDPENGTGNLRSDVLKRLHRLFQEQGVPLPSSQHDINVKELPELRGVATAQDKP